MADEKFSQFTNGGNLQTTDIVVGLRSGANYQFSAAPIGNITVSDDNATNATMYPLWVNNNTGTLAPFVSSSELTWNPGLQIMTFNDASNGSGTVSIQSTQSGGQNITFNTSLVDVFSGLSFLQGGTAFYQVGIQNNGLDFTEGLSIYDQVNSNFVLKTDPFGDLGPVVGATFFQGSGYSFSQTASTQVFYADSNNMVAGSNNFTWNIGTGTLSVNDPSAPFGGYSINTTCNANFARLQFNGDFTQTPDNLGGYLEWNDTATPTGLMQIGYLPSSTTNTFAFHDLFTPSYPLQFDQFGAINSITNGFTAVYTDTPFWQFQTATAANHIVTTDANNYISSIPFSSLASTVQFVYISPTGNDSTGLGTISSPFLTYDHARTYAVSLTPSPSNQFVIYAAPGQYTGMTDLVYDPWVHLYGQNAYFQGSGSVVQDASVWGNNNNQSFVMTGPNLVLDFAGSIDFDMTGVTPRNNIFILDGVRYINITGFLAKGVGTSTWYVKDVRPLSVTQSGSNPPFVDFIFQDCYGEISDCSINNLQYNLSSFEFESESLPFQVKDNSIHGNYSSTGVSGIKTANIEFSGNYIYGTSSASGTDIILNVDGNIGTTAVAISSGATVNYSYSKVSALDIVQGTNATAGQGAVLVAGTVTVNTTAVNTGDIILLNCTAAGGTQGFITTSIVNATSFTLTSSSALDTSTFSWVIIKST